MAASGKGEDTIVALLLLKVAEAEAVRWMRRIEEVEA